jgi:FlaA1/EpsC-like NDP-sugar epimerase
MSSSMSSSISRFTSSIWPMRIIGKASSILLRCRALFVLGLQIGLILGSLVSAWLLRFEFRMPEPRLLWAAAPILIAVRLLVMPFFNLMHGWWRYTGIRDAMDVLKAVLTGSVVFLLMVRYGLGLAGFPLSIFALEALLTFMLLSGVRVVSRMLAETVGRDPASKRLLLIGAGHAAQMIIRETQEVKTGLKVAGCLDDNPLKKGLRILGVPVLGPVETLVKTIRQEKIDEVLIAIPSATPEQLRRLVGICKEAGIAFRVVPEMAELIAGRVTLEQAREVSLTDLLGRIPVDLDLESVREHIRGRVVMVTGAAGSIGSELCRQIRSYKPKQLVCLDQNETGIFHLQHQLAIGNNDHGEPQGNGHHPIAADTDITNGINNDRNIFCVADFCNPERMRKLFLTHGVEIVFHAAAYKHVHVMEANVEEAVSNNVFGLLALLNVAENSNCKTFLMISSDKAVNPTNVMGCTKRIGELILAAWPGKGLRCVSVRFGNVLGSNGSVIPLFQEQIRQNQPITITHPEMTRFFMTIAEAVSLVLQAFAIGRSGDILVLDMGEPVRVAELAKNLVRLSGKSPQEFKFIGLRPGEKLFEELFYPEERVLPSACAKIACTESAKLSWPALKRGLDELYVAMSLGERLPILAQLQNIVPQFIYAGSEQAGNQTGNEEKLSRRATSSTMPNASAVKSDPPSGARADPYHNPNCDPNYDPNDDPDYEAPTFIDTPRSSHRSWRESSQLGPLGGGLGD